MNLTSTSDVLQLITTAAATLDAQASWVDQTTADFTPGRTNTAISSAATTTVVGSPAASTQRAVTSLKVRNTHATDPNTVTVRHTDGTTAVNIYKVTLLAGESIEYDGKTFQRYNSAGVPVSIANSSPADVQVFTASGTWTKPTTFDATFVQVVVIGAGGGGGAGASLATNTSCPGGGGGGGGAYCSAIFRASDLAATESVTIGAGGTAGVPGAAGANGGAGGIGGTSIFGSAPKLSAYGGGGGSGGYSAAMAACGGGGGSTATASTSGAVGGNGGSHGGGGGGGGVGMNPGLGGAGGTGGGGAIYVFSW